MGGFVRGPFSAAGLGKRPLGVRFASTATRPMSVIQAASSAPRKPTLPGPLYRVAGLTAWRRVAAGVVSLKFDLRLLWIRCSSRCVI